jgi:hypothetical protein
LTNQIAFSTLSLLDDITVVLIGCARVSEVFRSEILYDWLHKVLQKSNMAFEAEKEKYKIALSTTRDIRNLVDGAFENAIKDFSTEKTKLKDTLVKLEKKLR